MNSLLPTYEKGSTAVLQLISRSEGLLSDVIVSKVDIRNDANALMGTIEGLNIRYNSTGIAEATFSVPVTWKDNTYCATWTFSANGVSQTYKTYFRVIDPVWNFSGNNVGNHDFQFIMLTRKLQLGCKEYIRVSVKEIYDRLYTINEAQCGLIYYKSQYSINQGSWCEMYFEDGVLNYLLDTSGMEKGNRWYAQVKIILDNGEIILSPLLGLTIV